MDKRSAGEGRERGRSSQKWFARRSHRAAIRSLSGPMSSLRLTLQNDMPPLLNHLHAHDASSSETNTIEGGRDPIAQDPRTLIDSNHAQDNNKHNYRSALIPQCVLY